MENVKIWTCAGCKHRWTSRIPRPPVCPACGERHHDAPEYLRARSARRALASSAEGA